jgi:hypothetical protein
MQIASKKLSEHLLKPFGSGLNNADLPIPLQVFSTPPSSAPATSHGTLPCDRSWTSTPRL